MADPQQTEIKRPLLTINTLVEREYVRIDGEPYELHSYETLPRYDMATLSILGKEMTPLIGKFQDGTLTDEDELKRFDDLLATFCRKVLMAPAAVHAKLQLPHRLNIVLTFMALSLPSLQHAREPLVGASRSKTSKRRPASRASTAARRKAG